MGIVIVQFDDWYCFQILREIKVKGFDASLYKTSQIFYPSKDGTKIPMFIVTKNVRRFKKY